MSYSKAFTPKQLEQLPKYIENELRKIEDHLKVFDYIPLRILHNAPDKPQIGIYAADGTNWNPGSGAGVYYYNGSTYTLMS